MKWEVEHKLRVTVVYTIEIHDLADYEAISTQGAADKQAEWFADGSDSPAEHLTYTKPDSITVNPVGWHTTDATVASMEGARPHEAA